MPWVRLSGTGRALRDMAHSRFDSELQSLQSQLNEHKSTKLSPHGLTSKERFVRKAMARDFVNQVHSQVYPMLPKLERCVDLGNREMVLECGPILNPEYYQFYCKLAFFKPEHEDFDPDNNSEVRPCYLQGLTMEGFCNVTKTPHTFLQLDLSSIFPEKVPHQWPLPLVPWY